LPFEAFYGIVMGLIKSSIMTFYLRIFGSDGSFRRSIWVVMTIVWLWVASEVLGTFLMCRPINYNWDFTVKGTCGNRNAGFVAAAALNTATDIMVLVLPMPFIWKLQLSTARKLSLIFLFSFGLLYVESPAIWSESQYY
jgi:hypothetical protein